MVLGYDPLEGPSSRPALATKNAWLALGLEGLACSILLDLCPPITMAVWMGFQNSPSLSSITVIISLSPTRCLRRTLWSVLGRFKKIHCKVLQSWYNPPTLVSGTSIERILEKGLPTFSKLRSLKTHDAVEFYGKLQDVSHAYLLPIMPFDAIQLGHNFEGLFVPGLGVQQYHKYATAMFELLPCLLPTTYLELHAKLSSVRVESKNGYDLLWHVLEITVPAFDPTVPLQQPRWDPDVDILEFSLHHKLYFRLQAKKQIYFTSRDCTTMFLKAITSSEYADIITTHQSNVNSFRDPDDKFFLPQNYHVTNIATLIHNHAKARVCDLGLRYHTEVDKLVV